MSTSKAFARFFGASLLCSRGEMPLFPPLTSSLRHFRPLPMQFFFFSLFREVEKELFSSCRVVSSGLVLGFPFFPVKLLTGSFFSIDDTLTIPQVSFPSPPSGGLNSALLISLPCRPASMRLSSTCSPPPFFRITNSRVFLYFGPPNLLIAFGFAPPLV